MMKKFKIEIEETRIFRHNLIVEAESEEDEDGELDEIECSDISEL